MILRLNVIIIFNTCSNTWGEDMVSSSALIFHFEEKTKLTVFFSESNESLSAQNVQREEENPMGQSPALAPNEGKF